MNTGLTYVPIVKGKRNDIAAVTRYLNDPVAGVKPLLEILPTPKAKTVDEHVAKFVRDVATSFSRAEIFVDFYGLMPDAVLNRGENATVGGFTQLRPLVSRVTPTYGLGRNDAVWSALRTIVRDYREGFCFRVSRDDLDDQAEETWGQIIERSAQLQVQNKDTDIILDLRSVAPGGETVLGDSVIDFLALNPGAHEYRNLIVVGSGVLRTVTEVEQEGLLEVARPELLIWSALARDLPDRVNLRFGDYGVIHPDFADGGGFQNANAKIRYTVGSRVLYFRGHRLFAPNGDFDQYHNLAKRVIADRCYRGRNASFGDAQLYACANRLVGPGNMGTWVMVDMNHHIAYTARQMQRLATRITVAASAREASKLLEIL